MSVYVLLLAVVATEALVELLYGAEILNKPRSLMRRIRFFDELLDCKYCMSVWVGFFSVVVCMLFWDATLVRLACCALCVHRLSNMLHVVLSAFQEEIFDLRINRKKYLDNIK